MKYKVVKRENANVEVEITFDAMEWENLLEGAYNKNKGKFTVVGFRKGKAPRKVIEKNYGTEVFYEEALQTGFSGAYMEILNKETDIEPIDGPELSVKALNEKGIVIVANIPVMPEVKVKKYKGFTVKVDKKEITDEDVNNEIKKAQMQNARMIDVTDRAVKKGDIANIDFEGSIDGKVFDGGTAKGFDLEIGSKSFIDTFEDQLVGLNINDEKDVVVTFPENYHVKDLAGKPATFKVKVNSIKVKELPELNDEFASSVSEFETFEAYKNNTKEMLIKMANDQAKIDKENKVIEEIVNSMEVEIPHTLIHQELDQIMQDLEYRLMYQGLKLEDYAKYMGTTVEQIKHDKHDEAEKSVKIRLALQYILKAENIEVKESEIEEKIAEIAQRVKKSVEEYKQNMTDERINYIKNDILMSKLLKFIDENNN